MSYDKPLEPPGFSIKRVRYLDDSDYNALLSGWGVFDKWALSASGIRVVVGSDCREYLWIPFEGGVILRQWPYVDSSYPKYYVQECVGPLIWRPSWFRYPSPFLFVVEGVLDALYLSQAFPAVALCGVHVDQEKAMLIQNWVETGGRVFVQLDGDQIQKTLEVCREISPEISVPCFLLDPGQDPPDLPLSKYAEAVVIPFSRALWYRGRPAVTNLVRD